MVNRCIMLFPEFMNMPVIDRIRDRYDPLARYVRPHITLVFPFESDITTAELSAHIADALSSTSPFEINLGGISPSPQLGNYLFLHVQKGSAEVAALHKKLYTGILREFYPEWLRDISYLPHMTVGHFDSKVELSLALQDAQTMTETFHTIVRAVSTEIIVENESSVLELDIPLV